MADCKSCKEARENPVVSRYAFEAALSAMERTVKKLWVVIIILLALLAGTNAAWIYYEAQFTEEQIEVRQENDSRYNNYIGHDGDIHNGETDDTDETPRS